MSYNPESTIIGLNTGQIEWNHDFDATRDDNLKWSGSESFTCKLIDVTGLIPAKGSACQLPGWGFMKTSTVKVANIEGDLALVTVNYTGVQDDDDGNGGTDENPFNKYTYELGIVTNEEPIITHPRYSSLFPEEGTTDEGKTLTGLYQGKYVETETKYTYAQSGYEEDESKNKTITSDVGKELADVLIKQKPEAYLVPGQIWRASFISKSLPSASILNDVGKITTAKGAPTVSSDRNWLFIGCNVIDQDGIFTITYEWQLSGKGKWDERFYS